LLIDAHAHLDHYRDDELDSVLGEIERHEIFTISTSMNGDSFRRALEIGERSRWVLPIFGVHPWHAHECAGRLAELEEATQRSPMLGEIGLDHHFVKEASLYPAQREVLEFFLAAAHAQGKIVNLHTKGAEREILELLGRFEIERAIVHWYSGPLDIFHEMAARGCCFTVGLEVLGAAHIRTIASQVPEGQLLTETDNPGAWRWLEGERGMPGHIRAVVATLAELRGTTAAAIETTVQANFARLIRDDPWLSAVREELF